MGIIRFFISSIYLGWQIESNWTRPFWFLVYHLIRPFSGILIVIFMYKAIGGDFENPFFPFIFTGMTFWTFVQNFLMGIPWAIISDREFFETIKYMVILPFPYYLHLFFRTLSLFLLSIFTSLFLLISGNFIFDLNFSINKTFFINLFSGIPVLAGIGYLASSIIFVSPRFAWILYEGISGILFLISGVIYTPSILPYPLNIISKYFPITIYLDGMRKGLGLEILSQNVIEVQKFYFPIILLLTGLVILALGILVFIYLENFAKNKGTLYETTGG